jgi:hypothetical protein
MFGRIARSINRSQKSKARPVQVVKGRKEGEYYVSADRPLREMIYPSPSEIQLLAISSVNEYKTYRMEAELGSAEIPGGGSL